MLRELWDPIKQEIADLKGKNSSLATDLKDRDSTIADQAKAIEQKDTIIEQLKAQPTLSDDDQAVVTEMKAEATAATPKSGG